MLAVGADGVLIYFSFAYHIFFFSLLLVDSPIDKEICLKGLLNPKQTIYNDNEVVVIPRGDTCTAKAILLLY